MASCPPACRDPPFATRAASCIRMSALSTLVMCWLTCCYVSSVVLANAVKGEGFGAIISEVAQYELNDVRSIKQDSFEVSCNKCFCVKCFKCHPCREEGFPAGIHFCRSGDRNAFLWTGMAANAHPLARRQHLGLPGGAAGAMDALWCLDDHSRHGAARARHAPRGQHTDSLTLFVHASTRSWP
jgi:hypothetical protein